MDIKCIFDSIGSFGFPVALSWYLLVRMETKLDKLTDAIQNLETTLAAK